MAPQADVVFDLAGTLCESTQDEATLFYDGAVGDLVHDEGVLAVRETVEGTRDAHVPRQ